MQKCMQSLLSRTEFAKRLEVPNSRNGMKGRGHRLPSGTNKNLGISNFVARNKNMQASETHNIVIRRAIARERLIKQTNTQPTIE
jgi:hypothetical protein